MPARNAQPPNYPTTADSSELDGTGGGLFRGTNRAILLLCFGISLVFWLSTKLSKTYTVTLRPKLEYILTPHEAFTEVPSMAFSVEVSARGWVLLFNMLRPATTVTVRIPERTKTVSARALRDATREAFSQGFTLLRIIPETLTVRTQQRIFRKLPLAGVIAARREARFQTIGALALEPDSVEVVGPKADIDRLKKCYTDTLRLANISGRQRGTLRIVAPPNIRVTPDEAQYAVTVEQRTEKQIRVPISVVGAPSGLKIYPKMATIVLAVGLSNYKLLDANSFELTADFRDMTANDFLQKSFVPLTLTKAPSTSNCPVLRIQPRNAEFVIYQ